jgi:hypothetical protein
MTINHKRVLIKELYEKNDKSLFRTVRVNTNLDFWNGKYYSSGIEGEHLGLTKLQDGTLVLIYSFDDDRASFTKIITPEEAIENIEKTQHYDLLKKYKFKELADLYRKWKGVKANE